MIRQSLFGMALALVRNYDSFNLGFVDGSDGGAGGMTSLRGFGVFNFDTTAARSGLAYDYTKTANR